MPDSAQFTRADLRVFLDQWFCGCGSPKDAAGALLHLLCLHPLYENRGEMNAWLGDAGDGVEYLLLYMLDHLELTEHGGTVGGGWLTEKGEKVRDALKREEGDGFEALFEQHCVHGFDIGDESHDCMAEWRAGSDQIQAGPNSSKDLEQDA